MNSALCLLLIIHNLPSIYLNNVIGTQTQRTPPPEFVTVGLADPDAPEGTAIFYADELPDEDQEDVQYVDDSEPLPPAMKQPLSLLLVPISERLIIEAAEMTSPNLVTKKSVQTTFESVYDLIPTVIPNATEDSISSGSQEISTSKTEPLTYHEQFAAGYMPFSDFSDLSADQVEKLKVIERCNLALDNFLSENRLLLTKTPPELPVKVSVMFIVTNIYAVNEREQTVTITTFIEMSWRDRRLLKATGPECSEFSFTLPNFSQSLWFPIWTIENSAERTLYYEAWEKFPATIHNRSIITWITSFRIVLNCPMNMHGFPLDAQHCAINIRSPHYFIEELQYYVYGLDQALLLWNENVSHPLWDITGQLARITSSNISGIEIGFRLERRPHFYVATLIVPTLLISIATVLAFILPSHSTEKLQTILTGILAYFLLLLNFNEVTPVASENIPILTIFYVVVISVGIFGSIFCALIVRVANTEKANRLLGGTVGMPGANNSSTHLFSSINNGNNSNKSNNRRFSVHTSALLADISTRNRLCRCMSSEQMNDTFLVVYIATLCITYFWLIVHTLSIRANHMEQDSRRYNYTPIQVF